MTQIASQIAIVLYPGFTALDFIGPYEVLRNLPDTEVRFVWHEPGPIAADSGVLLVGATHSFDETPSPDVILVPGGMSTFEHAQDSKVLDWVRRAHETASWTTSVCSGSLILAAAGVLNGKRATSHWMVVPMLRTFGVTPVSDERIVREDHIVTAAGVSAGIDLGLWLAGLEFALPIGIITGMLVFVPYIGMLSGLLLATLWACYGGAAYLFQRQLNVFAHAAVLGGIAVYGASIMLIAQMYHMEGNAPEAVLM